MTRQFMLPDAHLLRAGPRRTGKSADAVIEHGPVSLPALVRRVASLVPRLARDEVRSFQLEVVVKLKAAGVGIGLVVVAVVFAFFLIVGLLAAAVLALSTVLSAWLAALVVAGALLVVALVLTIVGLRQLKRGVPLTPSDSITSIEADVRAVKGALQ